MNFIKNSQNHSFMKMPMKILDICNSRVICKYHPFVVCIISHTIGLIGVTELDIYATVALTGPF